MAILCLGLLTAHTVYDVTSFIDEVRIAGNWVHYSTNSMAVQ